MILYDNLQRVEQALKNFNQCHFTTQLVMGSDSEDCTYTSVSLLHGEEFAYISFFLQGEGESESVLNYRIKRNDDIQSRSLDVLDPEAVAAFIDEALEKTIPSQIPPQVTMISEPKGQECRSSI